jgi:hypothetical protein
MAIFQPHNNAIMGAVPREMLGTASAVVTAARQVGASSGIAIAGAFFSAHEEYYLTHFTNSGLAQAVAKKWLLLPGSERH